MACMDCDELLEKLRLAKEAIRKAQWMGEGGHWEEGACPFCGARAHGDHGTPAGMHRDGCIVEALGVVDTTTPGGKDG